MAIDLNDPTTWDIDDKDLMDLAKTGAIDTPDEAVKEEPVAVEAAPEEVPLKPAVVEPEGDIQAADGKNIIPYTVLREARDDARAARARAAQLEQELEALRAQPVAAAPVQQAAPVNTVPEEVQAQIDKIRENWGDDIANQAERTWRLEQQTRYQQQIIEQLYQQQQTQQQAQQRSEADQIADAIAASPKLDAWAKADDQGWFDRAIELNAMLIKTDRAYATASWYDRMKQLPDKVEAIFGSSFVKIDAAGAKAKAKAAMESPPTSLSEMSGGSPPERTEMQKLEDLEGNALTAYMAKLASDPKKFESYLRSMS